ncbi:hypothetical protein FAES_pFAES01077 (plasmid) [Fibrella aestuarina BUZ 2]|uniref:Cyclic GMP-AMP synthase n=1 Tax=Fibrella aestuarina BUZ 2 TaxID=1166018 RepID=I0KHG8_9BACT|nr:nucleotidyltransferase [Fibrella aestuarina]CCH03571.1 hypothetical protein FAES_pFAES01077 [Fibrella aestuarina BUZ 2]
MTTLSPSLTDYSSILTRITELLDITPAQYEKAVSHYKAVGKWLDAPGSSLALYKPIIYPQGSFRYGTVIKPLTDEEEFDVDLVCRLLINKRLVNQQTLKAMVGNRLKAHTDYRRMLDKEGRRCWRLNYNEAERFHLDILPSIPDDFGWLIQAGVLPELASHALCITDRETWGVGIEWPRSNPEGYARWFHSRMKYIFAQERIRLANRMEMKVEDVPEYRVKTVLQRIVQLLKRHRDIMFGDDAEKPISIIITTLAAWAYQEEPDLERAMRQVLTAMPGLVRVEQGKYVIPNPVNPLENFADRWADTPRKAEKFFQWIAQAQLDFAKIGQIKGLPNAASSLKAQFGENIVNRALNSIGNDARQLRESGQLTMERSTGIISSAVGGLTVPQHTFHGLH